MKSPRGTCRSALNKHVLALAYVLGALTVAEPGGAMWVDNFDDASAWAVTCADGSKCEWQIAALPGREGKCLQIRADPRKAAPISVARTIDLPRPRWISFRLRSGEDVPAARLKLRLRLESPDYPLEFTPRFKQICGEWHEFEADINSPLSMVNVWRFYGLRRLTRMILTIEDPSGNPDFDLFLSHLKFRYGEDIVENYRPRQIELHPSDPPSIAACMNTAGEYYRLEDVLKEQFPAATLSVHSFRGPHLPLDNWPPDLSTVSLVVMVDADTVVLSDRKLADLADYLHGGGALLVFAGPNSVCASIDGRPLAHRILPAEPTASTPAGSESALSGVLGGKLPCAGRLHTVAPKPGAEVLLSDGEGRSVAVLGDFGRGRVALVTCYPDARKDRDKSIFWSPAYPSLLASLVSRVAGIDAAHADAGAVTDRPVRSDLRVRFPYHKRVFEPHGTLEFTVIGGSDAAGSIVDVFLTDTAGAKVWEAHGIIDAGGELAVRGGLPDLADGRYTLTINSGDRASISAEIVIAPPLDRQTFYPIIARLPVRQRGHWLGPNTLQWMVEDAASHGMNTIAVPVLDSIAADPQGFTAETAGLLEFYAQEKGLAIMYDYSHLPTFRHRSRPPFDVRSPDAGRRGAELAAPMAEAADLVPRLFAVKTIDEPTANFANLNLDSDGGEAYRRKCGFDAPDAKRESTLAGVDRLRHWLFVADYARRQFQVLYDLFRTQKKQWKLLHTFMEPGFGAESPTVRFEDVFAWGDTADYLDFDIYPYWYPESQKRRFAKVHYGFAFQRAVARFHDRPMGFYVELDDRNYPFQKNPVEATGELAYTAVGEGCHYLNTFIYGVFGAGNMARPERWEDGGEDFRAIAGTTPFLLSTERATAGIALYFPYRQWIISGRYYPTFGLELFRRTFGECDLLHEEIVCRAGLSPYKGLVLLQTNIIPESVEEMLLEFVESGGTLVLDHCPSLSPEGAALSKLKKAVGEMPSADPWKAETVALGNGFVIKVPEGLDAVYRTAVESDDSDTVHRLESWAGTLFAERGVVPAARCSDGEFEAGLLRGERASAVVIVNHHPEPAQTVVELGPVGHPIEYVCDLATGRALDFRRSDDRVTIPVHLTQRQGVTLGLYPTKPEKPRLRARLEGDQFVLNLSEPTGGPLPIFIEVTDPTGRTSVRHSREILLTGKAEIRSRLAVNDRAGEWRFRTAVPALGVEMTQSVSR